MAVTVTEIADALVEHLQLPECPHDPVNLQMVCDGMGNWTIGAQNTTAKAEDKKCCGDKDTPK